MSDPNRIFESMEEYYKFTRNYSTDYFRGRITGSDEDDAEITVSFRRGALRCEVRRGLFEPEELRGLAITNGHDNQLVDMPDADVPRGVRHRDYVEWFGWHSGASSFEEVAFVQHFVFTFDEQRRTLF